MIKFPKLQFATHGRSAPLHRRERDLYVRERRILAGLGLSLLVLAGMYVYFISMSAVNVVLREELSIAIASTHSSIGELESEYLEKTFAIDRNLADTLGFKEIESKHFVSHVDATDALTFNNGN